jgi:hypothetical protein
VRSGDRQLLVLDRRNRLPAAAADRTLVHARYPESGRLTATTPVTEDQRPRTVAERVMDEERLRPEKAACGGS